MTLDELNAADSPSAALSAGWQAALAASNQTGALTATLTAVARERAAGKLIYPAASEVWRALALTPLEAVKVVILGQDPYHGAGQAEGLSFSVAKGCPVPPSLRNIYKALTVDFPAFIAPAHGHLAAWARQGVLLLNSVLSVEAGQANSHAGLGWEAITDQLISAISAECHGVVFLLWGKPAQKKARHIDSTRHHVLMAAHPSPLSAYRGFFDCGHFRAANELLVAQGKTPIDWAAIAK
ncbi:MAG: uracil-DNA glycosylase [Aeromonas sp.]